MSTQMTYFRMNTPLLGKIGGVGEVPQRCWIHPGAWRDSDRTAAMRDDSTPENLQKNCATCGAPLVRREGERPHLFRKRKTCGGVCATALGLLSRPSRKGVPLLRNRKPPVAKTCEYCSRTYTPSHSKQRFCSHACGNTGSRKPMPLINCAHCGSVFEPIRGNKPRQFCSSRCAYDARKGLSSWNKSVWSTLTCQRCSKPFDVPPAQAKRADRKYCSRSCGAQARMRERSRDKTTWIEEAVQLALTELGIAFDAQAKVGRYHVDALIPSQSLVIECFGDFWHCNPDVYPDGPVNEVHRKQPERDQRRIAYLKARGYRVVILWERDIARIGARQLLEQALDRSH